MPTLSLCLIVRNAEATLGRALASARPFVEELVVVDTGSTDATPEVARAAGANLFEFAWCDDFSAARNYSLDQATCDWILWIDADDELPAASGEILRRAIAEHPQRDAAFWVTVEERSRDARGQPRLMGHAHVKVFPRHPAIRFQYRLHEQIAPSIHALGLPILPTGAAIRHHADRSPAAEEARRQRNLRLAELDLAERPDDPFVHLSLGTSCLFLPGALPRAIEHLRQSVAGLVPGSPTQLNALLYLGQALGTGGDRQAERQLYEQALASFPDDAVLLMRLGNLCERMGQLDEAIRWYESCLARGRVRMSVAHLRGGQARVALRLGQSYLRLGQRQRARELWQEFLSKQPRATAVQRALASLERPARADATGAAAGQGATRFLIVIPAHNVRPFLAPLVASLAEQSWPHWQALFIDDASTDGTLPALADLLAVRGLTSRFTLMQNRQRRYKAYAVYHALADRGRPDDVVVMLDGDDHLASSEALARLATEYEQGWEVVWSNWRGSDGSRGTSSHLHPFLSPRQQPLVSSHLFSFRRRLFDAVQPRDLQDDAGQWFQAGADLAIAWPILEQTVRRKHIADVLYVYNRANPLSHDRQAAGPRPLVSPQQAQTAAVLRRRPGREAPADAAFVQSHLYELLQAAAQATQQTIRREIEAALARQAGAQGEEERDD